MTVLDDKLVPKAKELLQKFGRDVQLINDQKTFDEATSKVSGASSFVSIKIVPPFPYERGLKGEDIAVDGNAQTYMAALDAPITPVIGRQIKDGTQQWSIVLVDPIYSGNSLALWRLVLKG